MTANQRYDVGGILLPRPFKLRRLGHVGFNFEDFETAKRLYLDVLGFRVTDFSLVPGFEEQAIFATHNSDHHSFVIAPTSLAAKRSPQVPGVTINQLSWEVGTLEEVADAIDFLTGRDVRMVRSGRDIPGSNWHVYFLDPDDHVCEIYCGMEQIGWDRTSKPTALHERRLAEIPSLPFMAESTEIARALERGVDITSGYRSDIDRETPYDVGGILMPRPFRITGHGPLGLYVRDTAESARFYTEVLGFKITETIRYSGHECIFLRCGMEHYSLALAPIALRQELGGNLATTVMSMGIQVGNYRQLKAASAYLVEGGWSIKEDFPPALHPGTDYAKHFVDHEGHCLHLYHHMEQVGWDGRPRPAAQRRTVITPWPDTLDELSDSYADQRLPGPLW